MRSRGPAGVSESVVLRTTEAHKRGYRLYEYMVAGAVYAAIVLSIKLPEAQAALVPEWVIDWIISHITGQIFTEQVALAKRMRAEPGRSEHVRAVAADPSFYEGWLAPRLARAALRAEVANVYIE